MRHHARFCALVFAAFVFIISADFNRALAQTPTPTPIQAGQVIISELRLRGPAGAEDEFVELYNNTDADIVVQATDTSAGWTVAISNGQITGALFTIPNGTLIPARGHLLGANVNGYSLCNYPSGNGAPVIVTAPAAVAAAAPCLTNGAGGTFSHTTPDRTWDFDVADGSGVALFSTTNGPSFNAATRLDAFGYTGSPALYKEGTGFPTVITLNAEHSYYRDQRSGLPRDTANNSSDFLLVGTAGGAPGIQTIPLLGAPGPENLNSPVQMNSRFGAALLDPGAAQSAPPNRVRDLNPGDPNISPNGTLMIRRTITNNTGLPVTRLRFRVINITTLGTPDSECAGTPCADLRAISSQDTTANVSTTPTPVPVRGLRLEEPPEQPAGGAYNSSLSADFVTLQTPLAVGASVNVEFKLGVVRGGPFRFFVNIEAQTASGQVILLTAPSGGGTNGATDVTGDKLTPDRNPSTPAPPGGGPHPTAPPRPAPGAEPRTEPRTVYFQPFIINVPRPAKVTSKRAARDAEAADDGAGVEKDAKEKESKDATTPAQPGAQEPAADAPGAPAAAADTAAPESPPATTRRAPAKKRPAARKAPRRAGQ